MTVSYALEKGETVEMEETDEMDKTALKYYLLEISFSLNEITTLFNMFSKFEKNNFKQFKMQFLATVLLQGQKGEPYNCNKKVLCYTYSSIISK